MTVKRPLNEKFINKIVIKVGTRLLTYETGKLNLRIIEKLVREMADLKNQGKDVLLVSSGAVGGVSVASGFKENLYLFRRDRLLPLSARVY